MIIYTFQNLVFSVPQYYCATKKKSLNDVFKNLLHVFLLLKRTNVKFKANFL